MELGDLYDKYSSNEPSLILRLKARFLRGSFAYFSVMKGHNIVIASSTHEYKKFKSFLIYLGLFLPVTLNKYYIRKVVEISGSKRKILVVPLVGMTHILTSAAGGLSAYLGLQVWGVLRSIYFASYLATLAFCVDDPHDKVYKQSKIMRNAL